jgi:hypothetical protein
LTVGSDSWVHYNARCHVDAPPRLVAKCTCREVAQKGDDFNFRGDLQLSHQILLQACITHSHANEIDDDNLNDSSG